jgi:hypothetical protein
LSLEVSAVRWDPAVKLVTFGTNNSLLSKEAIEQKIEDKIDERIPLKLKAWNMFFGRKQDAIEKFKNTR